MSAGSWISWCRPFIRLSGAQTGRNIPVMPGRLAKFCYPLNPPISWSLMGCTVEVPVHFFKPSHVFEMVLKKNSAKNGGVWSWYAPKYPKFRGPWENVAVMMERTNVSFKHHLPLFRNPLETLGKMDWLYIHFEGQVASHGGYFIWGKGLELSSSERNEQQSMNAHLAFTVGSRQCGLTLFFIKIAGTVHLRLSD